MQSQDNYELGPGGGPGDRGAWGPDDRGAFGASKSDLLSISTSNGMFMSLGNLQGKWGWAAARFWLGERVVYGVSPVAEQMKMCWFNGRTSKQMSACWPRLNRCVLVTPRPPCSRPGASNVCCQWLDSCLLFAAPFVQQASKPATNIPTKPTHLAGGATTVDSARNEECYGKGVSSSDILSGERNCVLLCFTLLVGGWPQLAVFTVQIRAGVCAQ